AKASSASPPPARHRTTSPRGIDERVIFRIFFPSTALPKQRASFYFHAMSVLEIKQELSRMSKRDRQELQAYLIRLKHETPKWKKAAARRVAEMKKGRGLTSAELQGRISAR